MSWETGAILTGGVATIAIYSFLISENRFYRFFEHLYIGLAAGFLPVFAIKNFLWPQIIQPMLGAPIYHYPDGTVSQEYDPRLLLYLLPMGFGLFYYFIYSKRFGWLAKLAIGFALGYSAGLTFKGFFAQMLPQFQASFKTVLVDRGGEIAADPDLHTIGGIFVFEHIFFVVTLLSVMYYFYFTFRRKTQAGVAFAATGRMLMMVCFGAFFGSTVMAREALLVERLQFLLVTWAREIQLVLGFG